MAIKHRHWSLYAYDEMTEQGAYRYAVNIEILDAVTENDAIRQAGKIITRKNYVLTQVRECNLCAMTKSGARFFDKETQSDED